MSADPWPPAPPDIAADNGHTLEWDPPFGISAVRRWTCTDCAHVVIDYRGNVYGSATEQVCETFREAVRQQIARDGAMGEALFGGLG